MTTTSIPTRETGSRSVAYKPCVLLVDDDDTLRMVLTRELHKHGFAVYSTASGAEAVEIFCRSTTWIDLVLMDMNMPGMSGPDTLMALRLADPSVLCCLMTADTRPTMVMSLLGKGAATVFAKPFDSITALCEKLRRLSCPPANNSGTEVGEVSPWRS